MYSIYFYYPSLAAAIILLIVFIALTLAGGYQFYQGLKTNKKRNLIGIPFLIGGCLEIGAFIARIVGTQNTESIPPYAAYYVLALIAPSVISISNYLCLERMILLLDMDTKVPFKPKKTLTAIIIGDRACAVLQGLGGGLLSAQKESIHHAGRIIVIVGLIAQLCFMVGFFLLGAIYQITLLGNPSVTAQSVKHVTFRKRNIQLVFFLICLSTIFILVRSVYRTVLVFEGFTGYLALHEVFVYVLDALMVVLAMTAFLLAEPYGVMNKIDLYKRDNEIVSDGELEVMKS